MESQNKQIKKHLEDGHTITAIEALEKFKCFRLGYHVSFTILQLRWSKMVYLFSVHKKKDLQGLRARKLFIFWQ